MSDVLMSLRGPVGRRDAESALRNRAECDPQRAQAYERYVLFFCNNLYTLKTNRPIWGSRGRSHEDTTPVPTSDGIACGGVGLTASPMASPMHG